MNTKDTKTSHDNQTNRSQDESKRPAQDKQKVGQPQGDRTAATDDQDEDEPVKPTKQADDSKPVMDRSDKSAANRGKK